MGEPIAMVRAVIELIAQRQENQLLGILIVLLVTSPLADRYLLRRRRVDYRVLYNSKIGLSPVALHDSDDPHASTDPGLIQYARMLDRMSIVIIRVRNTGGYDIEPSDFSSPLSFTFKDRVIWDARISEATTDELRRSTRERMEFFSSTPGQGTDNKGVHAVRELLGRRLSAWLGTAQADRAEDAPQWHGVTMGGLALRRGESFKLVVVLREPNGSPHGAISKDVRVDGAFHSGWVKDEKRRHRISWPRAATALGAVLALTLAGNLFVNYYKTPGPKLKCASGELRLEGASAFSDPLGEISSEYTKTCHSARIGIQLAGSRAGMHDLSASGPKHRDELAVLNDGPDTTKLAIDLRSRPLAVVVYSIIVSDSASVNDLSAAQIKDVYQGRYHWWDQLGGRHVPIRIVGRDGESGSRQIFQDKLLGRTEGAASSTECAESTPPPHAPTIRCELRTTGELIDKVATTPGAIGYADAPTAKTEAARRQTFHVLPLDGRLPEATSIAQGYRFWTIEYLYTAGDPRTGSLLRGFLDFLSGDNARAELSIRGYPPCVDRDGDRNPLCTATP